MNETHNDISVSGAVTSKYGFQYEPLVYRWAFWRRAWFLVSAVPRYLFTGNVKLP